MERGRVHKFRRVDGLLCRCGQVGKTSDQEGKQMNDIKIPPPCLEFLKSTLVEAADGKAVMRYDPTEDMTNPFGNVQGGILAAMLDNVMGPAGFSVGEGRAHSTIQMSISFLGKAVPGEALIGEARVVKQGKTQILVEGELYRESDRTLIARATAVNLFLDTFC
jgi:uncharacterized protein (TIGR00369 family)